MNWALLNSHHVDFMAAHTKSKITNYKNYDII